MVPQLQMQTKELCLKEQLRKHLDMSTYQMLNATVFSFSVLTNGDQIHISVGGLVALDGHTGTYVGIKVKGLSQQQVHGGVASSYRRLQRSCTLSVC